MWLNPFFKCSDCGKLHTRMFVSPTTKCKCGRKLYVQLFLD